LNNARYPVLRKAVQERLECSGAASARIVEGLRDLPGAPIECGRGLHGYNYADSGEHPYELPGPWLNVPEIHALLAGQEFLKNEERLELKAPYSDPREPVQDALRHGAGVEVIGPPELINFAGNRLSRALSQYQ